MRREYNPSYCNSDTHNVSVDQLVDRVTRIGRYVRTRYALEAAFGDKDPRGADLVNTATVSLRPHDIRRSALDAAIDQPATASAIVGDSQYQLSVSIPPASNYLNQPPIYQRYELRRTVELRGSDAICRLVAGVAFQRMGDSQTLQKYPLGVVNGIELEQFAQDSNDTQLQESLARDAAEKEKFGLMALNDSERAGTFVTDTAIQSMLDGETTASPQIMSELDVLLSSWRVIAGMRLDMSTTHII